jgi:hypothetical protein
MFALPRTAARLANIVVATTIALLATQLLLVGFEAEPLASAERIDSIANWIERRPLAGAGILGGLALAAIGVTVLAGALWPASRPPTITTRRRNGRTQIDRASLADAIDRQLTATDTTADVSVTVRRSGRIDLDIDTLDAATDGPATRMHQTLDELVERRHLPCRPGTITVKPQRTRGRSRRILR